MPQPGMMRDTAEAPRPGNGLPGEVALIDELAVADNKRGVEVRIAPAFKLRSEPAEQVGIHALGIGRANHPAVILVSCVRRCLHRLPSKSARQVTGLRSGTKNPDAARRL